MTGNVTLKKCAGDSTGNKKRHRKTGEQSTRMQMRLRNRIQLFQTAM